MEIPASVRMFLQPRRTMRWVLDSDPNYGVMSIAVLAGVTALLRSSLIHGAHPLPGFVGFHDGVDAVIAYGIGATPTLPLYVLTVTLIGALFGVLGVYLGGVLLWVLGKALGGLGRYQDVRSAMAWSFVPYSWLLPLWIAAAIAYLPELREVGFSYTAFVPPIDDQPLLVLVYADYWTRLLCLFWLVHKLAVAHRFATWKAVLATMAMGSALVYLAPRYAPLGF